jgi:hypothetical protein
MATEWVDVFFLNGGDVVSNAYLDMISGNLNHLKELQAVPGSQVLYNNGADYTTTEATFEDVDTDNIKVTITTLGGPVRVSVLCTVLHGSIGGRIHFDIDVDGTRVGNANTNGLGARGNASVASASDTEDFVAFSVMVFGLGAGEHTFKLQWRTPVGTATMHSETGKEPAGISAVELIGAGA